MPTLTAQEGVGTWSPTADIKPLGGVEFAPDPRVFQIDSVEDVADCLKAWSPELAVYDFTPNVDIDALALQSAKELIQRRQDLYTERMQDPRYQSLVQFIRREVNRHKALNQTGDPRYTIRTSKQVG